MRGSNRPKRPHFTRRILRMLTIFAGLQVPGKVVLEQHSITLGLFPPPGNHAEVCLRATLNHFCFIFVITATCQRLFWNNTPSLWADFGDRRNMPKSVLEQHSITFGSFWSPPLWRRPKAASFVLAMSTGHILVLRRKTYALLRAKTSALSRKTSAV